LVTDRGFIDIYKLKNDEDTGLMVHYPQIANLWTTPENIDYFVDFLADHRNVIFPKD